MRVRIFRNRNYKVRTLQVINHLMLVPAFYYGNALWWSAAIFMYFMMFCVGIDIGVHRHFSHRSFKTTKWKEYLLGLLMTLATVGSTLAWVGMHRQHHKYSDKELDPHSPVNEKNHFWNFIKVYFGLWKFYVAKPEFTQDLRRSALHRFFHYYYLLVIFVYCAVLYIIDPLTVVFLYCVPAVFSFHAASLIVSAGHTFGGRDEMTEDQSRDSVFLHWLTWGEGTHNLHHARPGLYRYTSGPAEKWYFFDLPGFIIDLFFLKKVPDVASQRKVIHRERS